MADTQRGDSSGFAFGDDDAIRLLCALLSPAAAQSLVLPLTSPAPGIDLSKSATAGQARLKASLDNSSKQAKLIGSTDIFSERTIVQPSKNPVVNQVLASEAMPGYLDGIRSAVQRVPGVHLAASRPVKDPERMAEKIVHQGQPAETVCDYGAAQISVPSRQAKDRVIHNVRRQFPVVREQDNFDRGDPEYGYRSHSMQVQMPNGASEELQIAPRELLEANEREHQDYEKGRAADLAGEDAEKVKEHARMKNHLAMKKFLLRSHDAVDLAGTPQSALAKGSTVQLADGSMGKVSYFDPRMGIVRVRTSQGKNLTVRRRHITVLDGINSRSVDSRPIGDSN